MTDEKITTLLERVFMILEDGEWQKADEYCEKVLDIDPKNSQAYLGKLMAEFRIRKKSDIENSDAVFENSNNYKKLISLGDAELVNLLETVNKKSQKKKNRKIKTIIAIGIPVLILLVVLPIVINSVVSPMMKYNKALEYAENGEYGLAISALNEMEDYKDSKEKRFALWNEFAKRDTLSAGSDHTVGIKSDGTVIATKRWSKFYSDQCEVGDWTDIVAVAAGWSHTVGLKSDGTVVATGLNNYGQCNVEGWSDIVSIDTHFTHTVGIKSDGTVVATGDNKKKQCNVDGWKDIAAVSTGYEHTVGLKFDGTVVAVGENFNGQCDVESWTDIVDIAAGQDFTVGLKSDGTLVCVGPYYQSYEFLEWEEIVEISASSNSVAGLKSNGTVVVASTNAYNDNGTIVFVDNAFYGQTDVDSWDNIVAFSQDSYHIVGLKPNGMVVVAGDEGNHRCDVDFWRNILVPDNKK